MKTDCVFFVDIPMVAELNIVLFLVPMNILLNVNSTFWIIENLLRVKD